ncbi:hypothetical protein ACQYAC_04115 (plasmid) [Bacillus sp. MM09(2025)]|uniref:hypothetical protein n=1 Tax=Bacillus sp. MM09(2025) TaxID=3422493 RepID=UPI003D286BA3
MNKIIKYFVALLLCISVFTMGNSYAEAASWKLVDSKKVSSRVGPNGIKLYGVKTGKARICLKDQFGGLRVDVYDNDGKGVQQSKLILNAVFIGNNKCVNFNAKPYIDGSNKSAEFIVLPTREPLTSYTLQLWHYK